MSYDPNTIINAADARLASGDLEGGQLVFQSALLDWVDHARESSGGEHEMRDAIVSLWLSYAHFLRKAKQFKSATDAYEQAVSCPIAGNSGTIWLDYARFLEEREKKRKAQDVYLRALVGDKENLEGAVTDDQDRQLLWQEFLEMMRKSNPQLTMASLQAAVENEHLGSTTTSPVPSGSVSPLRSGSPVPPASKRQKRWGKADDGAEESKTHVVTAESVEAEAHDLLQRTNQSSLPPEIAAAWMIRDGDSPAQPPEPLFGPTPPKLSDPAGNDILGEELALKIMECLIKPSGTPTLQVCRALWTMNALQEQEATKALERLDQNLMEEYEKLETTLDARLSVSGAARSAVVQMNDKERESFHIACQQQRQSLWNGVAWEARHLLCVQQTLLSHMNVPGFDGGPTVDASALALQTRACSFLHSAFYLRNRIGEDPHLAMLKSQRERLKKVMSDPNRSVSPVPPSGAAYGATNYGQQQQLPPPPPPPMMQPPPPGGMHMQQQGMGYPGQPPQQQGGPYGQQQQQQYYYQ
jgi:tetratricopeptide (TPR) repeat protein